ncbi:MAG: transposase [Bacteroidia bacterium]
MKYNPQTHHRKSIRLKGYDYSQEGLYFVTICCYNMQCLFGTISNDEMLFNDAGKIAEECWFEIPQHFPNVILHEHVIMPNHVHGIIEIANTTTVLVNDEISSNDDSGHENVGAKNLSPEHTPIPENNTANNNIRDDDTVDDGKRKAEGFPPLPANIPLSHGPTNSTNKNIPKEPTNIKLSPQFKSPSKTVGSIVRGYKTGVTNWFRKNRADEFPRGRPVWQRDFYEHIIRDEQAYQNISNYIINNPRNWKGDKFYKS